MCCALRTCRQIRVMGHTRCMLPILVVVNDLSALGASGGYAIEFGSVRERPRAVACLHVNASRRAVRVPSQVYSQMCLRHGVVYVRDNGGGRTSRQRSSCFTSSMSFMSCLNWAINVPCAAAIRAHVICAWLGSANMRSYFSLRPYLQFLDTFRQQRALLLLRRAAQLPLLQHLQALRNLLLHFEHLLVRVLDLWLIVIVRHVFVSAGSSARQQGQLLFKGRGVGHAGLLCRGATPRRGPSGPAPTPPLLQRLQRW